MRKAGREKVIGYLIGALGGALIGGLIGYIGKCNGGS
jgi:hypothetical protein